MLLVLLLTACHDSTDAIDEAPVDILSRFNSEGKAWISLDINLPGAGALTRATTFDDGDAAEYAVKTMTIVLFSGTTEATATLASSATYTIPDTDPTDPDIEGPTMQAPTNDQVTCTLQLTSENIAPQSNVFLLVMLNMPTGTTLTTGQTMAELPATNIKNNIGGTDYYVMSNAPLIASTAYSSLPTVPTTVTLPRIDPTMFFATKEDAQSAPAAQIYVERAAVKVTVTESVTSPKQVLGNTYINFESSDMAYAIDNYNETSRPVRIFTPMAQTRFYEPTPLPSGQHRTYWATDNNYSGKSGLTSVDHATYIAYTNEQKAAFWHAMGTSNYCAENTFDVNHMQDDCTTSVLVRLQLNNGSDFYTTSITGQDIIFQPPSNKVTEEGTSASSSFSRTSTRSAVVTYDGTNTATIDDYLRTWLWQTNSAFRNWVNTYAAGEPKHVSIAVTTPTGGGTATATVTQTAQASGSTGATAFASLALNEYIADNITLTFYDDGYCYYRVPVRHFNDTQTPWASAPTMTDNTTTQAYSTTAATAVGGSTADATFLGRYGMVRNNWYTIGITGVTHVGSPVIPSLTTDADDRIEQLLNATLNIASWTTNTGDL